MKKVISLLLGLLLLTSCAMAQTEQPDMETIYEVNALEAWLKAAPRVNVAVSGYLPDGSPEPFTEVYSLGADGTALYEASDGYMEYASDERTYVSDPSIGQTFVTVFLDDDQYERYMDAYFYNYAMHYTEGETITNVESADGALLVTTEAPTTEDEKQQLAGFGDVSACRTVYTLDPATNLIQGMKAYLIVGDEAKLRVEASVSYTQEPITVPAFVAQMRSADPRTLTMHYQGQTLEYTIYKDHLVRYYKPAGYESYADENYTPLGDIDSQLDSVVYLLPAK